MIRSRRVVAPIAGAAVAAVVMTGCVPTRELRTVSDAPALEELGEVHAISADPANGRLYVAAHEGIWVAERPDSDWQALDRVGDVDAVAVIIADDGTLFASAHSEEEGALLSSDDGGAAWKAVDGEPIVADLLRSSGATLAAHDGRNQSLRVSRDEGLTWEPRTTTAVRDLAVDLTDGDRMWILGGDGLEQSTNGGRDFSPVRNTPQLARIASAGGDGKLVALAQDRGRIWTWDGDDSAWRAKGRYSGTATALAYSDGDAPYTAVVDDRGVLVTDDFGYSWTALTAAPNEPGT
jgi:hypothetical protein